MPNEDSLVFKLLFLTSGSVKDHLDDPVIYNNGVVHLNNR